MKILQSSIFRAICAIVVGALIIKYREDATTWLTIAIGVLFFLSGLISCIVFLTAKRNDGEVQLFDAQGAPITTSKPTFPIVGIGSILLGALLAMAPSLFIHGLMYVLAAILILGAINQFFILASAKKYAHIGFAWWLFPAIILLVGLTAIIRPNLIASASLLVIGWCMIVYGAIDLVNAIKVSRCRKAYEKAHLPVTEQPSVSGAAATPALTTLDNAEPAESNGTNNSETNGQTSEPDASGLSV